jgi:hypothetical protein
MSPLAPYRGGWHITPNYLNRPGWLANNCTLHEVALLLQLLGLAKSRTHSVEVTNEKLRELTGFNRLALRRAVDGLIELGLIKGWPVDSMKTTWRYVIAQGLPNVGNSAFDDTGADESTVVDRTAELRAALTMVPSLEGKPGPARRVPEAVVAQGAADDRRDGNE